MLKVGLIGIGFMGRGHLENYLRLEQEGFPVKLVALCDVDAAKWEGKFAGGNIDVGTSAIDFSKFNLYSSLTDMLKNEQLDYVDIALPTYLHAEAAIEAMNAGCHVLCEKPMALSTKQCDAMLEASKKNGKTLMIAQCLRFWPAYEALKDIVDSNRFGKCVSGYFFRGGSTPLWSFEGWISKKEKSGGALLDQHVHDVDIIHWIFGVPEHVSASGRVIIPGSGYDAVSANYYFADGKVINAQDDWTLNGDFGFEMNFRVNFEKGIAVLTKDGLLTLYPHDGATEVVDLRSDIGYYYEIKYFAECVAAGKPVEQCLPISTRNTIAIAEAEIASCEAKGAPMKPVLA